MQINQIANQIDTNSSTNQLLNLLMLSLQPDSQTLNYARNQIQNLSSKDGYIISLIQIIYNINVDQHTTLAALAQLKNHLQKKWFRSNYQPQGIKIIRVNQEDQKYFLYNFLNLFKQLADSPLYSKLLIEIAFIVGKQLFPTYTNTLVQHFKNRQDIKTCLKLILGTASSFRYSEPKEQIQYHQLLEGIYPVLFQILEQEWLKLVQMYRINQQQNYTLFKDVYQINYLILKFAYKTINIETKHSCHHKLILARMAIQILSADIPQTFQGNTKEWNDLEHNSGRFFCMHARKWSLKYLERYIQRAIPAKKRGSFQYSKSNFYINQGTTLLVLLVKLLKTQSFSKMHYHELIVLERLASQRRPLFIENISHTQELFSSVLQQYLIMDQSDLKLAEEEPSTFCQLQNNYRISRQLSHPREIALCAWNAIIFDTKNKSLNKILIEKSIQLIYHWITTNIQSCEAGLLLLAKISRHSSICEYPLFNQITAFLPQIFRNNQNPILIFRILGVINQLGIYVGQQFLVEIRDWTVNHIILHQGEKTGWAAFIAIRGAFALDHIFCLPALCNIELDLVKLLLNSLLTMVSTFEMEEIMSSFRHLVQRFSKDLVTEAEKLIQMMSNYAIQYNERDYKQSYNSPCSYNENYVSIARYSIQVVSTFVGQLGSAVPTLRPVLEREIIKILTNVLSMPECAGDQYFDQVFPLLSHYLDSLPTHQLSEQMWFIYKVLVFRITGLPEKLLQQFKLLQSEDPRIAMLLNCIERKTYGFQPYILPLRSYLRHFQIQQYILRPLNEVHKMPPSANPLQLIIYLCVSFYQNEKQNQKNYDNGKVFALLMLIYLQQIHGSALSPPTKIKMVSLIKASATLIQTKPFLHKYTLQLFCLWIYFQNDQNLLNQFRKLGEHKFHNLFNSFFSKGVKRGLKDLNQIIQRSRVIIGFAKLLGLAFKAPRFIQPISYILISWILYYMQQNCRDQQLLDDQQGQYTVYEADDEQDIFQGLGIKDLGLPNTGETLLSDEEQQQLSNQIQHYRESDQFDLDQNYEQPYGSQIETEPQLDILNLLVQIRKANETFYNKIMDQSESNIQRLFNILEWLGLVDQPEYSPLILGYYGDEFQCRWENQEQEDDTIEGNTTAEQYNNQM